MAKPAIIVRSALPAMPRVERLASRSIPLAVVGGKIVTTDPLAD